MARSIIETIDQIIAIAPKSEARNGNLFHGLLKLRRTCAYLTPEGVNGAWYRLSEVVAAILPADPENESNPEWVRDIQRVLQGGWKA